MKNIIQYHIENYENIACLRYLDIDNLCFSLHSQQNMSIFSIFSDSRVVWVKSKKNGKLASVKYLTNMSVQEMAKGEPFWSVTASTNSAPDHQREGQFAQLPCQACHEEEEAARCTSPLVNCHDQPCLLVPSLMSRVTTGINDAKFLVKVCTQHNI